MTTPAEDVSAAVDWARQWIARRGPHGESSRHLATFVRTVQPGVCAETTPGLFSLRWLQCSLLTGHKCQHRDPDGTTWGRIAHAHGPPSARHDLAGEQQ